jgi:FliI/YscN family ATPase
MTLELGEHIEALDWLSSVEVRGRVTELVGLLIRAAVPGARVGEVCLIRSPHSARELRAEVVGFRGSEVILMPLGDIHDVSMGAEVVSTGAPLTVKVGDGLLGRVLDGLGEPADGRGAVEEAQERAVTARPPDPLRRRRVLKPLSTGVRAIDGLLTVGEGQRVGIYAAAGVGKSTLLGMLARNTEADVNVIALVGERGREVRDFIEHDLGEEGLGDEVRARAARGGARGGRAAGARRLPALGLQRAAAAARTHGQLGARLDHGLLHRARRGRRPDRAHRRRDALHPRRPRRAHARARLRGPLPGHRRGAVGLARDAGGRYAPAP